MALRHDFAARLRTLRKSRDLTQSELAERIGRSVDAISNIERGKSLPSLEMLVAIAAKLGVELVDLIPGTASKVSARRAALLASLAATATTLNDRDLELAVAQVEAIARRRPA